MRKKRLLARAGVLCLLVLLGIPAFTQNSGAQLGTVNLGNQPSGQYTLQAVQLPVDPSTLANGYYVLKLISAGGTVQVPFLVLHR